MFPKRRHACPGERRQIGGGEVLRIYLLTLRLDRRVDIEQSGDIQHRDRERLADKIARVVHGDMVCRSAMAVHDKDPLEAVLSDLPADVRDQGPEGRLTKFVRPGMYGDVADLIRARRAVVNHRHHDEVPIRQCDAETIRDASRFVVDAERVGSDRQMGAVLLEHSHGQDKQRPITIQGIDLRPRQFFYREDLAADRLSVRAVGRSSWHASTCAVATGRRRCPCPVPR